MKNEPNKDSKDREEEIDRRLNAEATMEKLRTPKSKIKELKTLDELKKDKK